MWHWDQGRMQYFQYDALRAVARFAINNDLKNDTPDHIRNTTGLEFAAPETHSPWRNYSRIFKLCFIISEDNGSAIPTDIARILARDGAVTCDEYIHFLVEATTAPSPALSNWKDLSQDKKVKHPLCFSLKYILAKAAGLNDYITPINEIIGAYIESDFSGDEDDTAFLGLMNKRKSYPSIVKNMDIRQARESIKFISQISYLHNAGKEVIASLSQEDAHEIFLSLSPVMGLREKDANKEIQRIAFLFRDGSQHDFFEYKSTILSDEKESGFYEGSKVKKTHVIIERNSKLRSLFFSRNPTAECDSCNLNTHVKYPWVERVLDLHHILPLSSGTRVDSRKGTMLEDLIPICPTCHRAIHRYYDNYLKSENKNDFVNGIEARFTYEEAKQKILNGGCYA